MAAYPSELITPTFWTELFEFSRVKARASGLVARQSHPPATQMFTLRPARPKPASHVRETSAAFILEQGAIRLSQSITDGR